MPPSPAPGAVPTGPVARHLAGHLRDRGATVRILDPESAAQAWPDGTTIFRGAVTDPRGAPDAFDGITHAFVAGLAGLVTETLRELSNLLLGGGARRVAVLASHGSDFEDEYSTETWQWLAFERALDQHDVEWTYVRPTALFANALVGGYPITGSAWARRIRQGETVEEFCPSAAYPFLDERDLAGVVAAVLLGSDRPEPVLDVSGTTISAAERLHMIGTALGRDVPWRPFPSEDVARARWRQQGWPEDTIEVTLWATQALAAHLEGTMPVLAEQEQTAALLLGRPTRTFAEWLDDHLAAFK